MINTIMKQNYFFKTGLVLLFMFNMSLSYGQDILTFEFSALTGSEVTADSNTNNANLSTSTISRGAGLTASNNSGRFNATNWSVGNVDTAITDEDYMEFTITPNPTYQFSVSSIIVNVQRSGTGPGAITLRSSVDGYASNLDSEKAIVDNTSVQQFTFTFSQANSTTPVTYRFYLHTAESTGGSGGFEGTGNDIIVNGTVSSASSSPSVGFDTATSTENETDATFNTTIPVTFSNYSSDVTLSVSVNGASTAEAGDYTLNTTSLTFNANGTQSISLDINDDADMDNETIVLDLAVTSGSATVSNSSHTVTIQDDDLPMIVISEVMYNTPSTDDEWIELYNNEGSSVDISNWSLEYNGNTFVFPGSTTLANNAYTVIAVGSNGDGTYNNDAPFTPDFNNLAVANSAVKDTNDTNKLGNTSGTITLKNASGNVVNQVTYSDSDQSSTDGVGATFEIIDVNSDNATTSSNWQASVVNGGSPGKVSGSTWTGAVDSNWNTAGNWQVGIPSNVSDVLIPSGVSNYPTISSAITVNSINVASAASLIANATVTGNVTYTRNLPTTNWYLIAPAVAGATIEDFITNNSLASGTAGNLGLASFTNNGATPWNYQNAASTGSLDAGLGYAVKLSAAGNISVRGSLNTTTVGPGIVNGSRNSFNLLGNPFTAYINSNTFTSLAANASLLAEQTVWLWDGTQYVTYNALNPIEIAPMQGFFVQAGSNGQVLFETSNQSHQSTDTFMRQEPKPSFELFVENNDTKRGTKVFFVDGKTTGWDNGYDSSMFGGVTNDFGVFTQLVSNDEGKKLAIQTLPSSNIETMVIPVGLIAEANKEVTFSVAATNLPSGVEIYLEDRVNNTFTNLLEGNHTITTKTAVNGIGQYYIHTSAKLSTDDISQNMANVSIYNSAKNEITVAGLQAKANVKVFSLLGEELVNTTIESNGVSKVALPNLSTGVYIVKLNSVLGSTTKKIILE